MDLKIIENDLPEGLASDFCQAEIVAVDTETSGLDWRKDQLKLVQLFAPSIGTVLLRRPSISSTNLATVLSERSVLKLFHFAPFDLRFIRSTCGAEVLNVRCTKAASKLLDPDVARSEHSLASLVRRYLHVELDKGTVRTSDWGTEALTEEQIRYAENDVKFLIPLWEHLTSLLERRGKVAVYEEICSYMIVDADLEIDGIPNPLTY